MKKFFKLGVYVTLFLFVFVACAKEEVNNNEKDNYVPVTLGKSEQKTIFNQLIINGKVHPNKDVMVMPKMVGKVVKVNVQVGKKVKKGDSLFELDKEDIQNQVTKAQSSLNVANVNLVRAKEQVDNAKNSLKRTKKLYEEGGLSKAQYEQAVLAASDTNVDAVEASVNQAQIIYDQSVKALKNVVVTAPVSGTIASINVEVGEFASTAQPAITIVDDSALSVQIDVTEDLINQLYKDKEVMLNIKAANISDLSSKIYTISPAPDARTQLYPVKILLENKDDKIKAGMFAGVSINVDIKENVIVVPSEAIVKENGKDIVYTIVKGKEDKAKANEISVGMDNGKDVEVKTGLDAGIDIIVKGQNFVQDGSVVKVIRGDQ